MYTIKQAAARSGVSVDLLRAWERRYGIVEPKRTPSGYRLYDDDAIERLATMRRLVDGGWSPGTAAAALLDPDAPSPTTVPARSPASATEDAGDAAAASAAASFVSAAAALDSRGIGAAIDDMFTGRSVERALRDQVFPALRELGAAWSRGDVSVAGEHLASHTVLRRLAAAFEASASPNGTGPEVVVGLAPGSRHELGLLGFAIVARRAGLRISYLGADLPLEDWLASTAGAAAAVIGVPTAADSRSALRVAAALAQERADLVVALGGPGIEPGSAGSHRYLALPADLDLAVSALRGAIDGGA